MAGWGVTYSTIDNRLDPHEGMYFRFAQDFAGIGGDARFIRTTADARLYKPLLEGSDFIGMLRVGAGNITGIGQQVSTIDNFFQGGETIRGFASLGYGPRYVNDFRHEHRAWRQELRQRHGRGAIPASRRAAGLRPARRGLCRRRHPVGHGRTFELWSGSRAATGATIYDDTAIRSSVGASILWASPFGPIRADFAEAINKKSYDTTQFFRIGTSAAF